MKLKAFSLLEVLIALLISGLVISAAYSGFLFTHKQFNKFKGITTELRDYFTMSEVLNREFENAKKVVKKSKYEIEIKEIDKSINYKFNSDYILRSIANETDTFWFNTTNIEMEVVNEITELPLVYYLKLSFENEERDESLSFYKSYGAISKIEQ